MFEQLCQVLLLVVHVVPEAETDIFEGMWYQEPQGRLRFTNTILSQVL